MENKYRILLFSSISKNEILSFDFPLIPEVGETIEITDVGVWEDDIFFINRRGFNPVIVDGQIQVLLYGELETEQHGEGKEWVQEEKNTPHILNLSKNKSEA